MTTPYHRETHLRIGDAERERAAAELGEHYALGRLTQDEHEERLGRIWTARTYADVAPQFVDLPGPHGPAPPAAPAATAPAHSAARRRRRLPTPLVAVLAVLVGVVVLAHLPVLLFLLLGWFVLTRHAGYGRPSRRPHRS